MYKEIIMYTVICDNCGKDSSDDSEYSGWNDKEYAWDCADADNWIEKDEKHYCPNCYSYDENDNLIINENK